MQPFSAAHFAFLESVNSPLSGEDEDAQVTAEDFALAVKVCSIAPALYQGAWQIPAHKINFTIADHFRVVSLANPHTRERAMAEWAGYYADFCTLPERLESDGQPPQPVSAPGVLAAIASALQYLPEGRVWTMPLNTLFAYGEIRAELKGAKIRFSPSEKQLEKIRKDMAEADEIGKRLLDERMSKQCQN
jgi:hypothetical protein